MKKCAILAVVLLATVFFTGCGTSGPNFTRVETFPPDRALVYIYREAKMAGSANNYTIWVNDEPLTNLANGGYHYYLAEPGEQNLKARTKVNALNAGLATTAQSRWEFINFSAEAGKTYYIRSKIGGFTGLRGKLVNKDVAIKQISRCKLTDPFPL